MKWQARNEDYSFAAAGVFGICGVFGVETARDLGYRGMRGVGALERVD